MSRTGESKIIHVVVGSTGSGKSTYGKQLADQLGSLHFSVDEWMHTLFEADKPKEPTFDWMMERINRIKEQIWQSATSLTDHNIAPVLEIGLTTRTDRSTLFQKAEDLGIEVHLHFLDVSVEERWQRVERRNKQRGETYSLEVTRDMFDFVENMWEPPTNHELSEWKMVRAIKPS